MRKQKTTMRNDVIPIENNRLFYLLITLGAIIFGLSISLFMVPYHIAPGGVSGVAIILNHLTGLPTGLIMAVLEIPIFFAGFKYLGAQFSVKVLYATIMTSLSTLVFSDIFHVKMTLPSNVEMLAPIFGAVIMGTGLGLIIRAGAATSGSGTIARIMARFSNLSIGNAIGLINSVVIIFAWVVFKDAVAAMYGLMALFISSKVIDVIVEGIDYARGVFIISSRTDEITEMILHDLKRGGTALHGKGMYTGHEKDVLFVVVERKQITGLVRQILAIDRKAFVIVTEVYEVYGEGFKPRF